MGKKTIYWHIYPQDEQAHIEKLNAFLERYCEQMPNELADIHKLVNLDFNLDRDESIINAWENLTKNYIPLLDHARNWPKSALNGADLASRLVEFVKTR